MKKKIVISMLLIVLIFTMVGCNKDSAGYVAKVNGQEISAKDFQVMVEQAAAMNNFDLSDPQLAVYKDMFELQVLERMIDELLLEMEAKNRNLEVNKEDVETELNNIKAQFASDKEFASYFKDNLKMTEKDIKNTIETQLLVQKLYEEVTKDITTTDVDTEKYYEEHKDEFYQDEQVRARHILVNTKEEAQEIIRLITEENKDMAELAMLKSTEEAAKTTKGDLGYFGRGRMVKPFEDAVFSMEIDELSKEPVQTSFGWHVIRVEDKLPATQYSYEEVKADLEERFIFEEKSDAFNKYMNELKEKAEIENKILEKLEAEQEKAAQEKLEQENSQQDLNEEANEGK
ncbi:MAG: peptidylprolyl isomerase [Peptococcales bacterium]